MFSANRLLPDRAPPRIRCVPPRGAEGGKVWVIPFVPRHGLPPRPDCVATTHKNSDTFGWFPGCGHERDPPSRWPGGWSGAMTPTRISQPDTVAGAASASHRFPITERWAEPNRFAVNAKGHSVELRLGRYPELTGWSVFVRIAFLSGEINSANIALSGWDQVDQTFHPALYRDT